VAQTSVIRIADEVEENGDASEGICADAQIRQVLGADWVECSAQKCVEVRRGANSQESSACANPTTRSRAMQTEAPQARNRRDAVDRGLPLVIKTRIS
jgi:hypothetical protein